ncbi:MAG: shikimate dehydrogenase [Acidimicrobiia bacterium]|nr:MAG: shikimate dehydrogenase [Acidimicrobiia bacterium]
MRFGVVGDPVDHSRSPAIHNAGFEAFGIDARFVALRTPADGFDAIVRDLRSGALDGVSVTMPHKDNAYDSVDDLDDLAARSLAVNTIVATRGRLHGYNTDVEGVRYAVSKLGLTEGSPVLVLGYGGAARAALVALDGPRPISISGRDLDKARAFVASVDVDTDLVAWETAMPDAIVVNATPLGMHGEDLPAGLVEAAAGFVDMTYGSGTTPAIRAAEQRHIPSADGLDMLVGQAVRAFELFTGRPAPLHVFEQAARAG